jgi:hypothetical protein
MQQVKITVEVDGEVVEQVVEQVDGTLEQMEDRIDALTRQLAAKTLQAIRRKIEHFHAMNIFNDADTAARTWTSPLKSTSTVAHPRSPATGAAAFWPATRRLLSPEE